MTEEELEEWKEKVYKSEDPCSFPDNILAELWREEYRRVNRLRHGEMEFEGRLEQSSIAINLLEEMRKDLKRVAKAKLNNHKLDCLKLEEKLSSMEYEFRVLFNKYFDCTGLSKIWARHRRGLS